MRNVGVQTKRSCVMAKPASVLPLKCSMEDQPTVDPAVGDVSESIAFGLLNDAEKLGQVLIMNSAYRTWFAQPTLNGFLSSHYDQINEAEAEYLKGKFKRLFQSASNARLHEQHLKRKLNNIENEILEEKIAIEKALIDEMEETRHLQNTGEVRSSLQIQLESTEQRDTIAQFELMELKKVHEELTTALSTMKLQNSQLVDPILEKLRKEVRLGLKG